MMTEKELYTNKFFSDESYGQIFLTYLIRFAKEYGVYDNFMKNIGSKDISNLTLFEIYCELWICLSRSTGLNGVITSVICFSLFNKIVKNENKYISTIGIHFGIKEMFYLIKQADVFHNVFFNMDSKHKKEFIYFFLNYAKTNEFGQYDFIKKYDYDDGLNKIEDAIKNI